MTATNDRYQDFVTSKLATHPPTGLIEVPELHATLFPFQRDLTTWALRRGRAAIFADTGLGKSRMLLEWARCVAAATEGRVLVLAPLAVGAQTVREAEAIGIHARQVRYAADVDAPIVVTNYDRLHHFDPATFAGVVLDESSILKSFDGKTTTKLIESFRATKFKLCATATPSPNDYTELGTHAEFLGVCTRQEMLSEYFVNDASDTQTWRLKGHARGAFWKWLATWSALLKRPSDLGYDSTGYDLPELRVTQHTIGADVTEINKAATSQTSLFAEPAKTLTERRAAKKSTVAERVRRVAELVTRECTCLGRCPTPRNENTPSDSDERSEKTRSIERDSKRTENDLGQASDEETSQKPIGLQRESGETKSFANATQKKRNSETATTFCESSGNTDLLASSTPPFSQSKVEAAQSASANQATPTSIDSPLDDSASITATALDAFADCYAAPATSASADFKTTPPSASQPPCTCGAGKNEPWLIWAELNAESEALTSAIPGATEIRGSDDPLLKESRLLAFANGEIRVLVTKVRIAGFGMNFQHCARMAFVGVNDSFEQYYQAIRRCWRFGQRRAVEVHVFASELEGEVVKNLQRKERDALAMAEQLSAETRDAVCAEVRGQTRQTITYKPGLAATAPTWLSKRTA